MRCGHNRCASQQQQQQQQHRTVRKLNPLRGRDPLPCMQCYNYSAITNKWSKNSDERPHRRVVTPRGGEWIRPTLTPIYMRPWAHKGESPQRHLDPFSRFCRANECDQQTDRPRYSVCSTGSYR